MRLAVPGELGAAEIETLKAASRASARRAGAAVARLTGFPLSLTVPDVRALPVDQVPYLLGGVETQVVALHLSITGGSCGELLAALDPESAARILTALVSTEPLALAGPTPLEQLSDLQRSCLLELGNILGATYASVLGDLTRSSLRTSPPTLAMDMAGAVTEQILVEMTRGHDAALVIATELVSRSREVRGHLLHLPDPATLTALLSGLRDASSSTASTGLAGS